MAKKSGRNDRTRQAIADAKIVTEANDRLNREIKIARHILIATLRRNWFRRSIKLPAELFEKPLPRDIEVKRTKNGKHYRIKLRKLQADS